MIYAALLALALTAAEDRTYHPVSVCGLAATSWTHVAVTGKVALVKREGDGDIHIRLEDKGCAAVAEIIPSLPLAAPKLGQRITVRGISRVDGRHKWSEVHPVEAWQIAQ